VPLHDPLEFGADLRRLFLHKFAAAPRMPHPLPPGKKFGVTEFPLALLDNAERRREFIDEHLAAPMAEAQSLKAKKQTPLFLVKVIDE